MQDMQELRTHFFYFFLDARLQHFTKNTFDPPAPENRSYQTTGSKIRPKKSGRSSVPHLTESPAVEGDGRGSCCPALPRD
jgi:hypothetical protein